MGAGGEQAFAESGEEDDVEDAAAHFVDAGDEDVAVAAQGRLAAQEAQTVG